MNTIEAIPGMDSELKAKLKEALDRQAKGIPFRASGKKEVFSEPRTKRTRGVSEGQPLTPRVRFVRGSDDIHFFRTLLTQQEKEEACQHMDQIREENRGFFGDSNVAVEHILPANILAPCRLG